MDFQGFTVLFDVILLYLCAVKRFYFQYFMSKSWGKLRKDFKCY